MPCQLINKQTRFATSTKLEQIFYVDTLREMDPDEVDMVWFSKIELNDMKREAEDMALALEEAIEKAAVAGLPNPLEDDFDDDDDEHLIGCFRGLESKTEEGNWESYKARKDVTNAVLDEQDSFLK